MKGIYKVGGCIRDELLGVPIKDVDYVAVGYKPEEFKGYKLVGKDFPVFLNENNEEIALARTERKSGIGYKGFQVNIENVTLKEDLARRDLTINSIAKIGDEYIDYFGGIEDLKNKVLRHTTEAFAEDALRVLRLARFYARYEGFTIAPETILLCRSLRDELRSLTKERVTIELRKVLKDGRAYLFFECLRDIGVLDILFPEIFDMIGCEHNNIYHMEGDVFNHTMLALRENKSSSWLVGLGILFHDAGKRLSFERYGNFHSHYSDEMVDEVVSGLRERYRFSGEELRVIHFSIKYHHFLHKIKDMNVKNIVKKMMARDFPRNVTEMSILIDVEKADCCGRILLVDGELISGRESFSGNDWILSAYQAVKSAKAVVVKGSVEMIKQNLLSVRKKAYKEACDAKRD